MPRTLLVTLLALSIVAGCTGKGAEEPVAQQDTAAEEEPAPTPVVTTAPPKPSPTPATNASSRPGNGTGQAGQTNTTPGRDGEDGNTTAPLAPSVTLEGDATATLIVGTQDGATYYERAPASLELPRAMPQNATLVATWTSQTPLDAVMHVSLDDVDDNSIADGEGASPLVVEISGAAFANATKLLASFYTPQPGAAAQASVHFALTVTYG